MDIARPGPGIGALPPRARLASTAPEQSLDGVWSFRVWPSLADALAGWDPAASPTAATTPGPGESASPTAASAPAWSQIDVPGHWNLQGHGSPAYSNVTYPFPLDPPHPPDANPIGDYLRTFTLDQALAGHRVWLRCDGIESAAELWLNGVWLGSTRGSRLVHEFDLGDALLPGVNTLAIRVAQFSDASYLEDQDMWWLPGIFRSVTLLARPIGGIDDATVTADFDPAAGRGLLAASARTWDGQWRQIPAVLEIEELGLSVPVGGTDAAGPVDIGTDDHGTGPVDIGTDVTDLVDIDPVDIGPVEPWSADRPRLYTARIVTAAETVTMRIGFRRVTADGGVLRLNGSPLKLRGVNRHEHRPRHGRVIDPERTRAELTLMKRHHITTVRTSHYPPHPIVLDLADELGLYLIDECDLETHGFVAVGWRDNPSDDARWREAYLDRIRRTVARDRNHASVLMWSLGNEAGTGANLEAMAAWLRTADPTRPIHYEGDQASTYVDVYSRMYPPHAEVHRILDEGEHAHLPFLLCEYAHAMGNGPGGLREYWEQVERHPRHAGGCVWEWIEHGIEVDGPDGPVIRYGGDFGEAVHDGNFVIDGLVSAHLEPRPGLSDVAAIYAPVRIEVAPDRRTLTVHNRHDSIDLGGVRLVWRREVDGAEVASGSIDLGADVPPIPAGTAADVELPDLPALTFAQADVLTVTARLAQANPWADAGHELGRGQQVRFAPADVPRAAAMDRAQGTGPANPAPRPAAAPSTPSIDLATPATSLRLGPIAFTAPTAGVWRAPTDNDMGVAWDLPEERPHAERWREAGMDRMTTRLMSIEPLTGGAVTVRSRSGTAIKDGFVDATLTWTPVGEGALLLDVHLAPAGVWEVPWARLGLDFVIDAAPLGLDFFGLGPLQSYPDTGLAASIGWWSSPASGLVVDHIRPQESGSRRQVRDATIATDDGQLRIRSLDEPFAITVSPYAREAIAAATHADQLRPDGLTHVSIDLLQAGVGTAACGPGPLPAYRLEAAAASARLLLTDPTCYP